MSTALATVLTNASTAVAADCSVPGRNPDAVMPTPTAPARRLAVSLLGSVLLSGCHTTTPAHQTPASPAPAITESRVVASQPAATGPGLTPPQRLNALADTITATPGDATTAIPYTYLRTQSWTRATNAITRAELRQWRRDSNGSGQEKIRRLPDLPGLNHQPERHEPALLAQAPETTTEHLSGGLHPYLPEPLPDDAPALADMLAPVELADEPAYPRLLANGVVTLASTQYLNQAQRATSLRVLAAIPGITYRGQSADIVGRTGLTFTIAADGSISQLLVNPGSGEILAAHERLSGRRTGLFSAVLILERGHTTDTGTTLRP
ncbi:hypothetical protein AB0B20_06405 [Micromonospora sp. NPDC049151]|uniref:hypothetical protein n=1 Tax=Micromonospora sp. NPDC049151 TaxID=3155648 RepID=UPI0033DBAB97